MERGIIRLYEDLIIKPGFSLKDMMPVAQKHSITLSVANEPKYVSYKTPKLKFHGKDVIATTYFEDQIIKRVTLYISDNSRGWADFDNIDQGNKKREQDAWLKKIIGTDPPYNYTWGIIESVFNTKSGFCQVVVSYK
jgi:hypothetical protein